jgi:hypothetical protein
MKHSYFDYFDAYFIEGWSTRLAETWRQLGPKYGSRETRGTWDFEDLEGNSTSDYPKLDNADRIKRGHEGETISESH